MEKLKILWFNWRCWLNPAMGGAEVFTREVAKRWVRAGHDVTLFTSEFPNCKKEELSNGVQILRDGGRFSVYRRAKRLYEKRFRLEDFDVIIDEINTLPFFAPKFADNGELVIALIHQLAREYWYYETPFPISYFGFHFLENRWLKKYVDVPTITVSESTRLDLAELGFKRVFVVTEGVNFELLEAVPDKLAVPVAAYVGRLKKAKRPVHAIEAYRIVKKEIPEAELWVIGDGPSREYLEKIAAEGVRFFRGLTNIERQLKVSQAWVLVNPSVREGWGLNIIEANMLGIPAVAYDVHGLRDSVRNGETGLLAEAGNVLDFAKKIISLLKNRELREQLGRNALEYSRRFKWDKTAEDFMKVIEANLSE